MAHSVIEKARTLYRARKYRETVDLLESSLLEHRDAPEFYFLLGSACIGLQDAASAITYLKRAEQLASSDDDVLAALAAAHLARRETDKALALYLEILERSPAHQLAKRGLDAIRRISADTKHGSMTNASNCIERACGLLPQAARTPPGKTLAIAGVVVAAAAALVVVVFSLPKPPPVRPEIASVELSSEDRANPVVVKGSFDLILAKDDAIASFEKAKALFMEYRDNLALMELNRILVSNASASIKIKAESLKRFTEEPNLLTLKDNLDYQVVTANPGLHDGCHVAWKGRPVNLVKGEGGFRFDFVIGYQDLKVIEGIPMALGSGDMGIVEGVPIELLARIEANGEGGFVLRCVQVRFLQ